MKHEINPIMVSIQNIDDLYIDSTRKDKNEPLMIRYDFLNDGNFYETERVPTSKSVAINS